MIKKYIIGEKRNKSRGRNRTINKFMYYYELKRKCYRAVFNLRIK